MSNTPSDAEILALAQQHLKAFAQFTGAGEVWFEGEVEFARAALAKWGTPQPALAPLSEMPYEKRKATQEGEQIGASDAWFKARHEMLDTIDRRNVFRAGFDRGWNAAIAAQ